MVPALDQPKHPTVRTERALWPQNPSYRARMDELEEEHRRNPNMRTAHNIEIDLPEECQNVIRKVSSATFTVTLQLPRYKAWYYAQDETASYRRYADNLRLIGLLENDRKPWLLKNPSHTGAAVCRGCSTCSPMPASSSPTAIRSKPSARRPA